MDSMDLDIDMDLDVDLVPDEPIAPEPVATDDPGNQSEGEVEDEENSLVPYKVYIYGLDKMNPDQVKAYASEHFPDSPFERIEWIDDDSANLIYASESIASQALTALASDPLQDVTLLTKKQLIPAKPSTQSPEAKLQVRIAVASDKKQRGAAQKSKFYLWNPEYDPEERRRHRNDYRDRDQGRHRRRRRSFDDEETNNFDVNFYDDDPASIARRVPESRPRRRRSYTPESERDDRPRDSFRQENRGKELFPLGGGGGGGGRRPGDSRNRSASPGRDRDGDRDMDEISRDRSNTRNRERARTMKDHMSRNSRSKELFPDSRGSGSGRLGGDSTEDTAEKLAKGITLPLMDDTSDMPTQSRKLKDRIHAPGEGRLADRISVPGAAVESAFNIRGTASSKSGSQQQGFAIKGGAGKSVKELFPEKFGDSNAGKELFADRTDGRKRRQKAGDLFD